jgi:hypothetical protein
MFRLDSSGGGRVLLHDLALCESYDYCNASHWFIDTPASSNEDIAGGKRSDRKGL